MPENESEVELEVANHSGFLLWNDRKLVVFYTNDLACTPSQDILDWKSPEAVKCVHGLCAINRWTGSEVFHRSTIEVPAIVAAYNLFMNGVDRMDQVRSTAPARRAERRLSMSIFTWLLDLSSHNAFAIYSQLRGMDKSLPNITFQEFKRRIAEQLVNPLRSSRKSSSRPQCDGGKRNLPPCEITETEAQTEMRKGDMRGVHVLLKTKNSTTARCFVCSLQQKVTRVRETCVGCKKGFLYQLFRCVSFPERLDGKARHFEYFSWRTKLRKI